MKMLIQDQWIARFRAAVEIEMQESGGKTADAYRAMASKTGLGYDRIYQIYTGKPTGRPKPPSARVMNAIERVYGDQLGTYPIGKLPAPPAPPQPPGVEQLMAVMDRMSEQLRELQQRADEPKMLQIGNAWPFRSVTRDEWNRLTEAQRAYIEAGIKVMLTPTGGSDGSDESEQHAA